MYVCMYVCAKNVKQVKESIGLLGALLWNTGKRVASRNNQSN